MGELEGVIKYHLKHQQEALSADIDLNELNAWRSILYRLRLIGRITGKYQGLGFGNISRRLTPESEEFVISGTQTGHLAMLGPEHYALIITASPEYNSIESSGLCQPSSEALTHACVYRQDPSIHAVIHVHSPELWHNTLQLELPHTATDIPYGSVEMAQTVSGLFSSGQLDSLKIFSMLGHEDGIVAFGSSLADAAILLISELAKALAIEKSAGDS